MSPRIARRSGSTARVLAVLGVLVLVGYPLLVAFAFSAGWPALAIALSLASLSALAWIVPYPWRGGVLALLAVLALGGIAAGRSAQLSYLPPIAVNLALAGWFGSTLRAGREPLISRFARLERGTLEPDLRRYSRKLTAIWVAFFVAMAVISAALAGLPSPMAWTWFTAFGNWLCVAALFFGEYAFRRMHFPHYAHASPVRVLALMRAQWRPTANATTGE